MSANILFVDDNKDILRAFIPGYCKMKATVL